MTSGIFQGLALDLFALFQIIIGAGYFVYIRCWDCYSWYMKVHHAVLFNLQMYHTFIRKCKSDTQQHARDNIPLAL